LPSKLDAEKKFSEKVVIVAKTMPDQGQVFCCSERQQEVRTTVPEGEIIAGNTIMIKSQDRLTKSILNTSQPFLRIRSSRPTQTRSPPPTADSSPDPSLNTTKEEKPRVENEIFHLPDLIKPEIWKLPWKMHVSG
jgi:hypothetical protein